MAVRRITFRGPPNLYTVWVMTGKFFVVVAILVAAGLVAVRKHAVSMLAQTRDK